ncbi:caspase domain-containing protein, partial [Russula ochroleuca]
MQSQSERSPVRSQTARSPMQGQTMRSHLRSQTVRSQPAQLQTVQSQHVQLGRGDFWPVRSQSAESQPAQSWPVRLRKRRALIIGINYSSQPDPNFRLRHCVEDAYSMAKFLCVGLGFAHHNVHVMTDGVDETPWDLPTKENILRAMSALVLDAQPYWHDSFFFYFSGLALRTVRLDRDGQPDGFTNYFCAMDYLGGYPSADTPGLIAGNTMRNLMVEPLPRRCRLTALFDCNLYATPLDLPYVYDLNGVVELSGHRDRLSSLHPRVSDANIVSLGTRRYDPSSLMTLQGSGAMRCAFIHCMMIFGSTLTYEMLLRVLGEYMRGHGFPQRPELSTSHEIDTDSQFI